MAATASAKAKPSSEWREYFLAFCEARGQPVDFGANFLFADGSMYATTSYEGPEYEPPADADELRRLQTTYWRMMRLELMEQLDSWSSVADGTYSTPFRMPKTMKRWKEEAPDKIAELENFLETCDRELSALEHGEPHPRWTARA